MTDRTVEITESVVLPVTGSAEGDAIPALARPRASRGIVWSVLAIVAVQVLLWVWACWQLTYYQDDWPLSYAALDHSLFARDWLLLDNNGYVAPLAAALAWLVVHAAPFDYHVALAAVVAFGLLLDWSVWVCLRTYLGRRPVTVVWFAVVALSPLWVAVVGWWTVGISIIPATVAMAWMLTEVKRFTVDGRARHLVGAVVLYAAALLCTPKSALLAVFLAFFVVCVLVTGSWRTRLRTVLLRWVVLWAGLLVVSLAWLALYLGRATSRGTSLSTAGTFWTLLRESFLGTFVPSLVGGTWSSGPGPVPYLGALSFLAVIVILEVVVLGVLLLRRVNHGPAAPLVPMAAMIVGNLLLLGWVAITYFGPEIGRQGRYWTDVLLPTVLCLALVATPLRDTEPTETEVDAVAGEEVAVDVAVPEPPGAHDDPPRIGAAEPLSLARRGWSLPAGFASAVAVACVLLFANSALVTTSSVGEQMRAGGGDVFLANAIAGLRSQPDAVILDRGMPSQIINPFIFPAEGQASRALRHWVTRQTFDQPTEQFRMFDDSGVLRPATLLPAATSIPGPRGSCGYLATSDPAVIAFPGPLYKWRWVVQLSYLAGGDFTVKVRAGDATVLVPVRRGLHSVQFVVVAGFSNLVVSTPSSRDALCTDFAAVGNLSPS